MVWPKSYFGAAAPEPGHSRLSKLTLPVRLALLVTGTMLPLIVFAVGVKVAVAHPDDPLPASARLALYGGVAAYLMGLVAFRLRLLREVDWEQLGGAVAVMVALALTAGVAAWAAAAILACVLALVIGREVTSRA